MAKTIFELTEGSAPLLTDYALTGEDPLNTHVLRRTTWQTIRNLFVGAPTAANDFIVGNGTVWQKKTLAETKTVLGIDAMTAVDGWVTVTDTWTYATATTFTISGDKTGVIQIGDCIKLTQTTVKYFNVVAVSYASPNTTVTVTAGSDFSLANEVITNPYYSHGNPIGFPASFNFALAPTGMTVATSSYKFHMNGRIVVVKISVTGTSTATTFAGTLPVVSSAGYGAFQFQNNGANSTTPGMYELGEGSTVINFFTSWTGGAWTASGGRAINGLIIVYWI